MERFTIRDIENLCQIKAHTLRIWEQRFSFFTSKRKESQHRYYDNDDLRLLLQVAFLYHGGWKISQIAALNENDRREAVSAARKQHPNEEQEVLTLVEAASKFDERLMRSCINDAVKSRGLEQATIGVFFPFLQRVGHLWLTNHVIPAQEHFSSNFIQHKIIAETESLAPVPLLHPPIILFTPRGEHHELPLLFLNFLLRKYGWPVYYLGCNIDALRMPETILNKASIFYLHLITNLTGELPDDYFESLCSRFPDKTFVASGAGIQHTQRSFRNLVLLRNDESILEFVCKGLVR